MITDKQLIGLPVETKSGTHLGKVHGFSLDPLSHAVLQYTVKNTTLLHDLFGKEYLIAAAQVLSLTEEKMVVDDLTVQESDRVPAASPAA